MSHPTRGKHWVTEPNDHIDIKIGKSGASAVAPSTVPEVLLSTVQKFGDRPAMALKRKDANGKLPSDWKYWTWTQYYNESKMFAKSLIHLKVDVFKIINILGFNSVFIYKFYI